MPTFRYFLLDGSRVDKGSPDWSAFLPTSRRSARGEADGDPVETVTRGDFFTAVRAFLQKAPHHRLSDAVSRRIGHTISPGSLESVDVFLEKHGQFYHPARVRTAAAGRKLHFVVNAACSEAGRALIGTDYENIRRLTRQFPYRFVPRVYHLGNVGSSGDQLQWRLFLGQWFEGYHEFHLDRTAPGKDVRMIAWVPRRGVVTLTRQQIEAVYFQASRILTAYCNLQTFEQIGAWHHAAGDFVVRLGPTVDLKLVTVRQYRPLFSGLDNDAEAVFQALLVFLLNMSVRMRIDRQAGTGELMWADEIAVPATIAGFFEGLRLQADCELIPDELPDLFRAYLRRLTAAELIDLLVSLAARGFAAGAESDLVLRHLESHASAVRSAI